jgi:hypothetical protein
MRFHTPSFLLGYGAGVASAVFARRLRPVALAVAAAGYRLADAVAVAAARRREDLSDLLAEARARAGRVASDARPS